MFTANHQGPCSRDALFDPFFLGPLGTVILPCFLCPWSAYTAGCKGTRLKIHDRNSLQIKTHKRVQKNTSISTYLNIFQYVYIYNILYIIILHIIIITYFNTLYNHRVQPGHHEFHQAAARPGTFGAARAHQTRRARGWHTDGAAGAIIGIAFEGCAWDAWNTGNPSIQWEFQDPKIGLIYGRYLQFRILKWPLINWPQQTRQTNPKNSSKMTSQLFWTLIASLSFTNPEFTFW